MLFIVRTLILVVTPAVNNLDQERKEGEDAVWISKHLGSTHGSTQKRRKDLQSQEGKRLHCFFLHARNVQPFGIRAESIIKVLACEDERSQPPMTRQWMIYIIILVDFYSQVGEDKINRHDKFAHGIRHENREESRQEK